MKLSLIKILCHQGTLKDDVKDGAFSIYLQKTPFLSVSVFLKRPVIIEKKSIKCRQIG